ncbi:MAG: SDR family NAD(P)-dependent oxidoreductase [Candidatus Hydrogenedentota bacterium]
MSDATDKNKANGEQLKPLAIVGIGSMFPKAQDLEQYWSNIKEGVDAITEVPDSHWSPDDYYDADQKRPDFTYGRRGGFIEPYKFDPLKYGMPPTTIEATDTAQLLGMVVAEQAMEDAGYGVTDDFDRDKVSVILGVTGALELVIPLGARLSHPQWRKAMQDAGMEAAQIEDAMSRMSDSYVDWQEASFPGLLGNVVAGRISKYLNTGGTNCVVDAACASSFSALHLAALELESGKADMVITGGTDTFNDIFMYMCFSKTPALSPTGNSKPFANDCDGTILGEGLGMVVLKRLEDAERDDDKIYAVLKGVGSSSDGKGDAIYAPSSPGQKKCLESAYRAAGVTPDTIELLEAHGTGTMKGDAVEASALCDVYGNGSERVGTWCALGSVKSQIGHTKSSAGAAGLIKAVLSLYNKVLPPTIKVDQPADAVAPGTTPFYVNTTKRPWVSSDGHPRRAGVSAFGFGGSNFHLVLEEYVPKKTEVDWDGLTQILAYSTDTPEELKVTVNKVADSDWATLRAEAKLSRESFDATKNCRLVLVIECGKSNFSKLKSAVTAGFDKHGGTESWSSPEGIYYGTGTPDGQLAFIFPGQGAQYTDMLKDLACQFPEMIDALDLADEVYGIGEDGTRLSDRIYPHPTFDKEFAKRDTAALTKTGVAQPAIGCVSLGAMNVLSRFDIAPEAAAGHSYGELTALHAGGVLTADGLVQASKLRGELMGAGEGDCGTMLAVRGDIAATQAVINEEELDVVIANKNSPEQAVLSGTTEAIQQAKGVFDARKISSTPLTVAAAFHSKLVADAAKPFAEGLADVEFSKATIPIFSNTTGEQYPKDIKEARTLLANQLANPVEFVNEITALYKSGVRTFIEVGPGARMTGLIKAILKDTSPNAYALDASNGKQSGITDLAKTLAQTAALGHTVDLAPWDEHFVVPPASDGKKRLILELTGANYRSDKSLKRMEKAATPPKPVAPATPASQQAVVSNPGIASMPQPVAPPVQSAPIPTDNSALSNLLAQTQSNIAALQQMQQQTAQLHAQFLQGQEQASKTFTTLMQQQQALYSQTGQVASMPVMPAATPVQPIAQTLQPIVPEPMTAPAPTVAPAQAKTSELVVKTLMAVVSEKTGYPEDMLELSMSLDADLGIDSIKRVEILSALQEQIPELPTIEADELGSIETLQDIVGKLDTVVTDDTLAGSPAAAQASQEQLTLVLLDIVSEKTGYPTDMLELSMSLDADLGIDSIKRVEILSALQESMPELPTIEAEVLGSLETLQNIVDHLKEYAPVGTPVSVPGATVQRLLMEIVSEKTGYPEDMLELEMSLDADLGIDSIKRVEILSALQEEMPELPSVEAEDMGALETLQDVLDYLADRSAAEAPAAVATSLSVNLDTMRSDLLDIISDKTGYPADMLDTSMSLDADLGIDSIKRVEILSAMQEAHPELPTVEAEALGNLETIDDVLRTLSESAPNPAPAQTENVSAPTVESPVDKIDRIQRQVITVGSVPAKRARFNLNADALWTILGDESDALTKAVTNELSERGFSTALTPSEDSQAVLLIAPEDGFDDDALKSAFFDVQAATRHLSELKSKTLFATVSRMDGQFGLTGACSESQALTGSLAGLAKTASHEWDTVNSRALDIASDFESKEVAAKAVVDELLQDAPVEMGLSANRIVTLELEDVSVDESAPLNFTSEDVIVISGGARGVTAEVAASFAEAGAPTLLLLGRSAAPSDEESWLAGVDSEAEIKKAIMQNTDEKLSPKDLQSVYDAIARNREMAQMIGRMEAAGSTLIYRSVDIRDAESVATILAEVRAEHGPITGFVHGAGVLADRFIHDKTREQFDNVYDTKVLGLRALLSALSNDPLKAMVLFSSSTGRFGRKGQVDYAMANEVLNKIAHTQSKARPDCRVVSVNWGPWAGGMVTPSLRAVFESEGIGLIGLQAGADYLLRELNQSPQGNQEIVILGCAGDAPVSTSTTDEEIVPTLTTTIDTQSHSFLKSHVIDGKAVLPVAIFVEWFAHTALHANPGLHYLGIDDVRVFKGVRIGESESLELALVATKSDQRNGKNLVHVTLRSGGNWSTLHAQGTVRLGTRYEVAEEIDSENSLGDYPHTMNEVYDNGLLFHGEAFQGICAVTGYGEGGVDATVQPAPSPTDWMTKPLRRKWVGDPMVMDCAFQAMILWVFEKYKAGSLPVSFKRYTQYQSSWPKGEVSIRARIEKDSAHQAVATIDCLSTKTGALLARIEGYECVIDASLNEAFQRAHLADNPSKG